MTTGLGSAISDHFLVESTLRFGANTYKIAAFNLQRYGSSKASDSNFVSTVKGLISNYDIILLQEITDSNQTVILPLIPSGYSYDLSPELGSTTYKEQYAYVYNSSVVKTNSFVSTTNVCKDGYLPKPSSTDSSCTAGGYDCGTSNYWTGAQCRAQKEGANKRVKDCCCGK